MRPVILAPELVDAAVGAEIRRPARPRRRALRLFVPPREFQRAVVYALAATLLALPFYDSPWLGGGVFASVFVAVHAMHASRRIPWIPGVVATIAAIQWVLAAWAAYHLEQIPYVAKMWLPAPEYFAFAVPTYLAFVTGLLWPLRREGRGYTLPKARIQLTPRLRTMCNVMIFGGIALRLGAVIHMPLSVRGAVYMLSDLQYVGAFTLLLAREPGWKWRLGLVLLGEAYWDSIDAQYLALVLWSLYSVLLIIHVQRIRPWKLLVGALGAAVAVMVINAAKKSVRDDVRQDRSLEQSERAALAADYATDVVTSPDQLFSANTVTMNVARLNQGVITSRILYWTPAHEPFAHGETIAKAVYASIVPRVLDPAKVTAGGFTNYPRFTGLQLLEGTSINLSIPGEMYANFGTGGAIIGCFIYGVFLALLYRMFVRLSRTSPLWWAWAPFILFSTVVAEMGLAEGLNEISKKLLITYVIVMFIPAWAPLRPRKKRALRRLVTPPEPATVPVPAEGLA